MQPPKRQPYKRKEPPSTLMYGMKWKTQDRAVIEGIMYGNGGYYTDKGVTGGHGPKHHFRELIKALAPWFAFNKYNELIIDAWAEHDTIAILGPASSGKTFTCAMCAYAEFYAHPIGTSILCSSITLPGLRLRVWGALTEIVRRVKQLRPDAPGHVVESDLRIYPAEPGEGERRTPKDAIIGLACKTGDEWIGIGPFVGLHNERVMGIFDEASLMPRSFWDATSNLRKSPKTKFVAIGNPKDTNDALGVMAEPHKSLGGWEGLGTPVKTCTWPTVGTNSIAIQLHGLDGPNFGPEGVKFPYLITPKQVEEDKLRYGEDSWQFQMMDLGVMPKGVGSRRVFTRQMCDRGNAFGEPWWDEATPRVDYLGLDASFCLDDGDRTAMIRLTVGKDVHGYQIAVVTDGPVIIPVSGNKFDENGKPMTAEDQIGVFVMQYAQANKIAPHRFGFDSTGRGALAVAFAKHWSPHIVPVEFGGRAPERQATTGQNKTERELYGKNVTALWFAARNAVIAGQVRNLPMSVFEEGAMREYVVTKDGKEDVEEKKITRQRLGKSPDLMDAFVVALEVARRNGFVIGGRSSASSKPIEVKWLTKQQDSFLSMVRSQQLSR